MDDFIEKFREFRQRALVPNLPINPNWISAFSVIVSFGVWWNPIIAVASALALDLLDGVVARGCVGRKGDRTGKLTDWACDRYSEFVIFGYFSITTLKPELAALPVLNTIVTILAAGGRKMPVLPLRHLLLLYLLIFKL